MCGNGVESPQNLCFHNIVLTTKSSIGLLKLELEDEDCVSCGGSGTVMDSVIGLNKVKLKRLIVSRRLWFFLFFFPDFFMRL